MFDKPEIKQDLEELDYWIVGGAVRDKLLEKEPKDKDYVVTGETAETMKNRGFKPVEASNFPVFLDSDDNEWALARKERKIDEGYHGFETFTDDVTIEEDLKRRDFTINAIAYNPETGAYEYPVAVENHKEAHGIRDLNEKIIRHITDAFEEDPVRILRLARFASRYPEFSIAHSTKLKAEEHSYKIENVPGERISKEIITAMEQAEDPTRFWRVLNTVSALRYISPEEYNLEKLENIEAGPDKHHEEENLWEHTMMVVDEMQKIDANNPEKLLMAFVHDIGKLETRNEENSGGHDKLGVEIVEKIADKWKLSNHYKEKMKDACREHMRIYNVDPKSQHSMRESKVLEIVKRLDHSKGATEQELLDLAEADCKGRIPEKEFWNRNRIKNRLKTAREAIETVDAQYVANQRDKKITDFDGKALGQTILNDRVHYMKQNFEPINKTLTQKAKGKIKKLFNR